MRLWCWLTGHKVIPVRKVGLRAKPGGLLPMIDGYVAYEADPQGTARACVRCRQVIVP